MPHFGDADPEDGYDADDPPREILDNLRRRLVAILLTEVLSDKARQRLEMIRDDLETLRERLAH